MKRWIVAGLLLAAAGCSDVLGPRHGYVHVRAENDALALSVQEGPCGGELRLAGWTNGAPIAMPADECRKLSVQTVGVFEVRVAPGKHITITVNND